MNGFVMSVHTHNDFAKVKAKVGVNVLGSEGKLTITQRFQVEHCLFHCKGRGLIFKHDVFLPEI